MVLQLYSTSCKWKLPGYSLGHDIDISGESDVSFADDTRVYRDVSDTSDCDILHRDLD